MIRNGETMTLRAEDVVIGDVVGRPGRTIVQRKLPGLIKDRKIDFVVANGENAAGGSGILPAHVGELRESGVDVVTTGDHIWKQAEIAGFIGGDVPLLRPLNYPPGAAGRGAAVFTARNGRKVGVGNLIGRVYLGPADCPFRAADAAVKALARETPIIVIDVHAEATSEKQAMSLYLDGRVTAVFGTHTHVATADECIRPRGTAYISDIGMTGPHDSVIGRRADRVLQRFITGMYAHFDVASGDVRLNGAVIDADPDTGKALSIERIVIRDSEQ